MTDAAPPPGGDARTRAFVARVKRRGYDLGDPHIAFGAGWNAALASLPLRTLLDAAEESYESGLAAPYEVAEWCEAIAAAEKALGESLRGEYSWRWP